MSNVLSREFPCLKGEFPQNMRNNYFTVKKAQQNFFPLNYNIYAY